MHSQSGRRHNRQRAFLSARSLSGQSNQAAKLVEILQGSGLLRNPALSGPIQPDARTQKDRFNITAGYGPAPDVEEGEDEAAPRR